MKTLKTKAYPIDLFSENYCARACGVHRHIWNWGLSKSFKLKEETDRLPSNYDLDKIYRQEIKEKPDKGFVWLAEQQVSPALMQEVMKDIRMSFAQCREVQKDFNKRRFKRLHKKPTHKTKKKHQNKFKVIKPKYKRRDDPKQSFRYYTSLERIGKVDSDHIFSLQTAIKGSRCRLRTSESLAFLRHADVKICTVTVKYEAGSWWICISYEKPNHKKACQTKDKIGIDLGVVKSVCGFDGENVIENDFNTKNSLKSEHLVKKLNQKLSRCKHGSRRWKELKELYAKRSARSARQRNAALEECTTFLANTYKEIVVDPFNFESAKLVCDNTDLYHSMTYQFKLRLEQKVLERNGIYREIEHKKGIKTTTKCSICGSTNVYVDETSERRVHCNHCKAVMDRDINAARNCYNY